MHININPRYAKIFNNYVKKFEEKARDKGIGILMTGNPGTGKTFFANCIWNELKHKNRVYKTSFGKWNFDVFLAGNNLTNQTNYTFLFLGNSINDSDDRVNDSINESDDTENDSDRRTIAMGHRRSWGICGDRELFLVDAKFPGMVP